MFNRRRNARRRRRAECPECGAPRLLTERLDRYRIEHEELWAAMELVTAERDQLLRRLSGVVEQAPDYPPPPGARHLGSKVSAWGRPGRSSTSA